MCDFGIAGAIIAGITAATTVTSTALGVVGAVSQANNAGAQYEYQEAVNRQNAKIASDNAAMERQKGLEDARWQRIKTMQAVGENKTSIASSGLDVNFGSNLDLIEDTSMMGELDALMIEANSERKAKSYDISANNYLNNANANSLSAFNANNRASMNLLNTGLGTVSKLVKF